MEEIVQSEMIDEVVPPMKWEVVWNVFHYGTTYERSELWKLQDGYGSRGYVPVQGYDWSGIRDSSYAAKLAMFQKFEHLLNDIEFQAHVVQSKKLEDARMTLLLKNVTFRRIK